MRVLPAVAQSNSGACKCFRIRPHAFAVRLVMDTRGTKGSFAPSSIELLAGRLVPGSKPTRSLKYLVVIATYF